MMRRDVFTRGILVATLLLTPARLLATTAAMLCGSNDPCVVSAPVSVDDKSMIDLGARGLHITAGGKLDVGPGTMSITAGTVTVDSGGFIVARGDGNATAGGTIMITAGSVTIAPPLANSPTGTLDASGSGGGDIEIVVTGGDVEIPGPIPNPAVGSIAARSLNPSADGGSIKITSATASIGAYLDVRGGPTDASAGTVTIATDGNLTISGTIDATGGDNSDNPCIDLSTNSAGNIMVTSSSILKGDATGDGGSGGGVNILTAGDGVTTGLVTISGVISVTGHSGTDGGGDGGDVYIETAGNILVDQTGAIHEDGGPDGGGASLTLQSDGAAVIVQGVVSNTATGPDSTAGDGCIEGKTDVAIGGMILFGGGGTLDVCADTGSVAIQASALIDASGDSGGISIDSGTNDTMPTTVLVEGTLSADGAAATNAGEIDLEAQDSVRVSPSGVLHASAATGSGGKAGIFSIISDKGGVSIEGMLTAEGAGANGAGASIVIEAASTVSISGPIDGKSPVAGGTVQIQSDTGPVAISSSVNVASAGAMGGSIMVTDAGDLIVSGTLTADGNTGGNIAMLGCNVTLCGQDAPNCPPGSLGVLSSNGSSGHNSVTGRSSTAILGNMRAGNGGNNTLIWSGKPGLMPPLTLGQIKPAQQIVVDSTIVPCPVCGDGIIEPPETCEPPTPNCSSDCQLETPLPGDVNGDQMVTTDDIGFLAEEIFDGDGDKVADVGKPTFIGAPGADANGDTVVTAADFIALIRILATAAP